MSELTVSMIQNAVQSLPGASALPNPVFMGYVNKAHYPKMRKMTVSSLRRAKRRSDRAEVKRMRLMKVRFGE